MKQHTKFFAISVALLVIACTCFKVRAQDAESSFERRYPTPFLRAIASGHEWIVNLRLHEGLSPNVEDGTEQNRSPLFVAVLHRRHRILEVLLSYKANTEVKDDNGITPLMAACYIKDFEAAQLLLDAGANVNGIAKVTPVMIAARYTDVKILDELIRRGADVHLRTDMGATALMVAGDDVKIVEVLIRAGSKVDTVDGTGWTALHHAIDQKRLAKIDGLVRAGARDDVPDKAGITPRHLAEQVGDPTVRRGILDILKLRRPRETVPPAH